jgi:Chloroplast envelope transporter
VAAIGARYGVDLAKALTEELKVIYGQYLEAAIPPGDAPLSGREADDIRQFKDALGLSDEDAAPVHIDVGRRFLRSRFEAGSRNEDVESRKVGACKIGRSVPIWQPSTGAKSGPWPTSGAAGGRVTQGPLCLEHMHAQAGPHSDGRGMRRTHANLCQGAGRPR